MAKQLSSYMRIPVDIDRDDKELMEALRGPKGDPGQSVKGDKGDSIEGPVSTKSGPKGDKGDSIKGEKGDQGRDSRSLNVDRCKISMGSRRSFNQRRRHEKTRSNSTRIRL